MRNLNIQHPTLSALKASKRRFKLSHLAPVDPPMETAASLDSASWLVMRFRVYL